MDVYRFRQHWRDLTEIGRMHLLIIVLFLLGLLVRVVFQGTGSPWVSNAVQDSRPSLRYDR